MAIADLTLLGATGAESLQNGSVPEMVCVLRKHLGMDIAFLGEFFQRNREIKFVDADGQDSPMQPGVCTPLEESYCKHIIGGKLPAVIHDATEYPVATALGVTRELGIRAYIAVPIHLADGRV